ncbi:hypothetical protein SY83_21700 [Paenibacillus swuensis]|uniref:Oxidoreductase molybdopterin-binding domain-containing protein n=1 Tax=Paenibacillus swuensis TaxID=1178515 RepID=A0A172TNB1_9BACL|nr:molybdopterin-dependent oxidoreductase [Paenibacillus swuensis]ANE48462.1 hypothetical protein SY83_21700 [Paenibacillus swuensis]
MAIRVREDGGKDMTCSVEDLVGQAPRHINLEERVRKARGRAFDLRSWYAVWAGEGQGEGEGADGPTHLIVEAEDEFQAIIPWHELDMASILYEQDGKPLQKGFPIRLYVPNGSSACLNVKSVVDIRFARDKQLGEAATYGYKNEVTLEQLRYKG